MPDTIVERDREHQADARRCDHQGGLPVSGPAVVCFQCFRARGARHASPAEQTDTLAATGRGPLEARRTLTPRELQHRQRMLEWLRRA
jgi:hypothetical protein